MVVFRHHHQIEFVLRYPCCESFIDQGFCIACIGKGKHVLDNNGDGKLLPYLLYVGYYVPHDFLREMPVCHINVTEAKRIINLIVNQQTEIETFFFSIKVWDTEGKCHVLRLYHGWSTNCFYDRLFHYVSSSVSTCVLHAPLSNLYLAEQYLWAIENRANEILELCQVMSSRTVLEYRFIKRTGSNEQVRQLLHSVYDILMQVGDALEYIDLEDQDQLQCMENALK